MDRIPPWLFPAAAAILVALRIWPATDENWSGVIASAVLTALVVVLAARRLRPH